MGASHCLVSLPGELPWPDSLSAPRAVPPATPSQDLCLCARDPPAPYWGKLAQGGLSPREPTADSGRITTGNNQEAITLVCFVSHPGVPFSSRSQRHRVHQQVRVIDTRESEEGDVAFPSFQNQWVIISVSYSLRELALQTLPANTSPMNPNALLLLHLVSCWRKVTGLRELSLSNRR